MVRKTANAHRQVLVAVCNSGIINQLSKWVESNRRAKIDNMISIAIDKQLTKQALVPHGIPMPGGQIVASESLYAGDPLPRPYVLKPVNEGSSVGVAIVTAEGNYGNPIARDSVGPWQEFPELLAEPYIRGRELTTAVLGDEALPRLGHGRQDPGRSLVRAVRSHAQVDLGRRGVVQEFLLDAEDGVLCWCL